MKNLLLLSCLSFGFSYSQAQSYSISPADTITGDAVFDDMNVYNILQNNLTPDTLWLSWEKVMADVPADWEAVNCDNNLCYTELKQSGNMYPILAGEAGLLSIHVTPHINSGTASIQYAVWETSNPTQKDTLTWIITSELTGIENEMNDVISVILSGSQLLINASEFNGQLLRIMNLDGRILVNETLNSSQVTYNLSRFSSGIYIVGLYSETSQQFTKIFLK